MTIVWPEAFEFVKGKHSFEEYMAFEKELIARARNYSYTFVVAVVMSSLILDPRGVMIFEVRAPDDYESLVIEQYPGATLLRFRKVEDQKAVDNDLSVD